MNDRDETIQRIKTALQRRSGKPWSVTGGRGTAWGWIAIDAPPKRRTWSHRLKNGGGVVGAPEDYKEYDTGKPNAGHMSPEDRAELGRLLGKAGPSYQDGESIPASGGHYQEYIDRAEGRAPTRLGVAYWD